MSNNTIVALGFSLADSDRIRLNHLSALVQGKQFAVVGVNEGRFDETTMQINGCLWRHLSANFSSAKGLKDMWVVRPAIVFLDYFWLQPNWAYGEGRYGNHWLSLGGQVEHAFTQAGTKLFILPLDDPRPDLSKTARLCIEKGKVVPLDIQHKLISTQSRLQILLGDNIKRLREYCNIEVIDRAQAKLFHPLVRSDQEVNDLIPGERVSAEYQLKYLQYDPNAFVVFYDKKWNSTDWRAYVNSLFETPTSTAK